MMIIQTISLPLMNRLANDYQSEKPEAMQFFQYAPYQADSYRERLQWLKQQAYPHRNQLADGLRAYNQQMNNHPAVFTQIEKLRLENTYVVIAGQQAGVLTGPMYTILKAIQVIQTARRLEKELNANVVPVFWIAGEDHDIDEINHVFAATDEQTKLVKMKLELAKKGRISASQLPLDLAACERLVDGFFKEHTETSYTPSLRALLKETTKESTTVVDWFARIIAALFGKHGLVLVESSSPFVRRLEQPVFRRLIEQNERVAELLVATGEQIRDAGYSLQLKTDSRQANLFLYEGKDRLLLEREGDRFRTKDGRSNYSKDQLLALLDSEPERFSANVVSRPLMQEHLFPTLAFVGGPGEIAYWAFYKQYFELLGYQLPIVLPRMTATLIDGAMQRTIEQLGLDLPTLFHQFADWKKKRLDEIADQGMVTRFDQTRQAILDLYQPLVAEVVERDRGLEELAAKNVERLLEQISFLEAQMERSSRTKHEIILKRIDRVQTMLLPEGTWQERVFSYFSFANKHGVDLLDRLVEAPFSIDGTHNILHV